MGTQNDNYIVVNPSTGEILCTGTANTEYLSDRPVVYQDSSNNTTMLLTLQEGETFSGDEDLNSYFENNETFPRIEIELSASHPFIESSTNTIVDDTGETVEINSYENRIEVEIGTKVVLSNVPPEIRTVLIIDGHANTSIVEQVDPYNNRISIVRDNEELTKVLFESPKHKTKTISIRFIDENSPY
jgi:hypothetical protein